ncbi:MAG: hypothetical protein K9J77_11725 [Rhodoferax sp.]|nr:hypothetical protein [Rhodoferax sp.]
MKHITRIKQLLNGFIAGPNEIERIERLLKYADNRGRSGFEKWLQYELVLYLTATNRMFDIETQLDVDNRKSQEKSYLQVDLTIKLKGFDTLDIELKVRHVLSKAIRALKSDRTKLSKIRPMARATGSFAVVLCGGVISLPRQKELMDEIPGLLIIPVGKEANFLVAEAI